MIQYIWRVDVKFTYSVVVHFAIPPIVYNVQVITFTQSIILHSNHYSWLAITTSIYLYSIKANQCDLQPIRLLETCHLPVHCTMYTFRALKLIMSTRKSVSRAQEREGHKITLTLPSCFMSNDSLKVWFNFYFFTFAYSCTHHYQLHTLCTTEWLILCTHQEWVHKCRAELVCHTRHIT